MGSKARKGSRFERTFAKRLSLWWTDNERDDVFWRSSNSGGRATARRKAGVSTFMQAGDIAATDPIGLPLLELITFELKRGYSTSTIAEVFDATPNHKKQQWELFVEQAISSHRDNGSYSWMLVTARDRRCPLVWYPGRLDALLFKMGCPRGEISYQFRLGLVCGKKLDDWFDHVSREDILDALEMENKK